MRKLDDFRVTGAEYTMAPEWQIVDGYLEMENPEELQEYDNLFYSGRSRLARMGIESGIMPREKGAKFWKSVRNRFDSGDLSYKDDGIEARIVIRNMNKVNYKKMGGLDIIEEIRGIEDHYIDFGEGLRDVPESWNPLFFGEPERKLILGKGDRVGRIVGFDNEEVAIDTSRQKEFWEAKKLYSQSNPRNDSSALRFYTQDGDHPDLDEVVQGTPYKHDGVARVLLPIDKYATTNIEGSITMKELEKMNKGPLKQNSILEIEGELPEKVNPGVHYAIIDNFENPDYNLILDDPEEFAQHTTARVIDHDFTGDQVALEFLFAGSNPGQENKFPETIPAYAIEN